MILHLLPQVHQKLLVRRHIAQVLECILLVAIRGESCLLSHGDAVVKAAISREKMASSSVDCTSKLDDEPAFNFRD